MVRMTLGLSLLAATLLGNTAAFADPHSPEIPSSSSTSSTTTVTSGNVLELAPIIGTRLPPPPPEIEHPEIPSPFIGCWEGHANGFDSEVSSTGVTLGSPGRIVFCYQPNRIVVPEAISR